MDFRVAALGAALRFTSKVSSRTWPATYPLGVGHNFAFYNARDTHKKLDYFFQANPTITNSVVTNAFLTIDFIGTNYLIGRFAFVGTNTVPFDITDTNTVATVSQGEFQLNFRH